MAHEADRNALLFHNDYNIEDVNARRDGAYALVTQYTDKHSRVPGWFEGEGAANILDENFAAKPAHRALRDDLSPGGTRRRG